MQGTLTFHRVTEGPDHIRGLYVDVSPATARSVRELWGRHRITRTWPTLQENAAATLRRIEQVGGGPEQSTCFAYQEGAAIFVGRDMVLVSNDFDEAPVLLSVVQCKQLLADWMTLLLARPHKTETLPEAVSFDYLAEGTVAEAQFYSAFKASS